jgi:hypothetical protein
LLSIFICFSHFQLNSSAEEDLRVIFRTPDTEKEEEDPEDDEEGEEESAPKRKAAPRPSKRPRGKASGTETRAIGEASAKKARTAPSSAKHCDSRKAERERIKMLANVGKATRPILPGAS